MFGLTTHKAKIKCKQLPTAFLQQLFFGTSGNHSSGASGSRPSSAKTPSRGRPSSGQSSNGRRQSASYHRTSPVLSRELTLSSGQPGRGHEQQTSASSDDALASPSLGSSRRLLQPHRAQTSPAKLSFGADDGRTIVSTASASSVPQALVVSGLENVGVPAQRALMHVLSKRLVELDEEAYEAEDTAIGECGVWPLPPNFITVYVCAINATDRPGVLSGLVCYTLRHARKPVLKPFALARQLRNVQYGASTKCPATSSQVALPDRCNVAFPILIVQIPPASARSQLGSNHPS